LDRLLGMKRLLWSGVAVLLTSSLAQQAQRPAIGTNLSSVNYYATQLPFVDIFKTAKEWHSGSSSAWDDGRKVAIDQNGNVERLEAGQFARTLMLRGLGGNYPKGVYTLSFEGEGELNVAFAARVLERQGKTWKLEVGNSDDGILLEIRATNPANPLRDFRLTMPGGICNGQPSQLVAQASQCVNSNFLEFAKNKDVLFNPTFLQRTAPYSALRMMDWAETNNSKQTNTRPKPTDASWGIHGVPLEVMIELANTLHKDLWLTIPHQSSQALMLEMAQTTARLLKPNLRVYLEHSNEVWNGQFQQHQYAVRQGRSANLANNDFEAALLYHAERTRAIGQLWRGMLGNRLIVVLAGQAANPWTLERPLEFLQQKYGATQINAIAIAPYMTLVPNPEQAPELETMTFEKLFAKVNREALPESLRWMRQNAEVAKKFGVQLLAYEAGQHLVGVQGAENREKLTNLFIAFNRDPRIGALYLEYLRGWQSVSSGVMMHFTDITRASKFGAWGALEHLYQSRATAPKYDAILRFLEGR
jgi:hypothetical protein